jgi:hypothetical protein
VLRVPGEKKGQAIFNLALKVAFHLINFRKSFIPGIGIPFILYPEFLEIRGK